MKKQIYFNVFITGINRTALREIKLLQELTHPNIIGVSMKQGCCLTIFQGAQKGKSQKVRSPTSNVLGDASKT